MGLGDREIVREASAKGTHLELAYKFLETRRHCSLPEAKAYFAGEVEIWVGTLLKKKQIHRASHILKNVVSLACVHKVSKIILVIVNCMCVTCDCRGKFLWIISEQRA